MPRLLLASLCAALCFACASSSPGTTIGTVLTPVAVAAGPAPVLTRKDIARKVMPASVRVFLDSNGTVRRSGTGVVIAKELASTGSGSYVITNAHVIDDRGVAAPRLRVVVERGAESFEYDADFVAAGSIPEMDLALIRLPGVMIDPVELARDGEVEPGDDVLVVAAPFGRGLTLAGGMVSQIEYDSGGTPRFLKTDASVGYGSSGGGMFSLKDGKLLAVVEGYRTTKVGFMLQNQDVSFDLPMPGETFAAPAGKVRRFLEDKGLTHLIEKSAPAQRYSSTSTH